MNPRQEAGDIFGRTTLQGRTISHARMAFMLVSVCALMLRGSPAQPSIWAVPGSVISVGSSVTIFCRIHHGVVQVRLSCAEPVPMFYDQIIEGTQEVAAFSLLNVTHVNAGLYYCSYWNQREWSKGDKLKLMVTGVYKEKPSLIVHSGPQVGSGGNVTLICQTPYFHSFILCRDRGVSFPQNCSCQNHNTFVISLVSPVDGGTYRCYGSDPKFYLWSLPSDPFELPVTGPPDHTVVWVSVAAVCLLILVLFLLFLCLCQRRWAKRRAINGETRSQVKCTSSSPAMNIEDQNTYDGFEDIQFKEHRQVDTQVSPTEDPQEVTYAQLHPQTFMRSMDPLPSSAFRDVSTESCVYVTLTMSQEESQP